MNYYAKAIVNEMDRNEMHYQVHETEGSSIIEFSFMDSIPVNIYYNIEDDSDAKIFTYLLRNIDISKKEAMQKAIEELNRKYRFLKLYMENDCDVCITYDFEFYGKDMELIGKHGVFSLIRICVLISDCLPVLLHAAYSESAEQVDEDETDFFNLFEEDADGAA